MKDVPALCQLPAEGRIALYNPRGWQERLLTGRDQDISNMINGTPRVKVLF